MPRLSSVTKAVVSLLTSKLAVTDVVGGGESRRESAVGTLCACRWAHVRTRVCEDGKRGGAVRAERLRRERQRTGF